MTKNYLAVWGMDLGGRGIFYFSQKLEIYIFWGWVLSFPNLSVFMGATTFSIMTLSLMTLSIILNKM
jgi:hypothetical protein